MSIRRALVLLAALLAAAALGGAAGARASANRVPVTAAEMISLPITPNDLAPPECAGIGVVTIIVATPGGMTNGTGASSLILGSPLADTIRAQNGTDCVLGGAGDDSLAGQGRDDVLIGGPGADSLDGGAGADACYGGPATDTFVACETAVQ